jgi:hypothetical protein
LRWEQRGGATRSGTLTPRHHADGCSADLEDRHGLNAMRTPPACRHCGGVSDVVWMQ